MPITFSDVQLIGGLTLTFPPYGSGLFNGTNQFLTAPSSTAFNMGGGNFTVEFWVNTSDASRTNQTFITTSSGATNFTGNNNQGFFLGTAGTSLLFLASTNQSTWDINISAGTLVSNVWTHVAGVRSGNTFTLYVNGTSVGTATASGSLTNNNNVVAIGGRVLSTGDPNQYTVGYLTNVRVVKGVAVYTSNFTRPTATLTSTQSANTNGNPSAAITGTQSSLVLGMTTSGTFLTDSSTNGFTVTNNNTATWNSASPFV